MWQSRLYCTRWDGKNKSDAINDAEFTGNILLLLREAMNFVKSNTRKGWEKLPNRYLALLKRDYHIITGQADKRLEKRIYRYGDAIGPLCFAVREDSNSPWKIKKIYYEKYGWRDADEDTAHYLRYGQCLSDTWG